MTTTMHILLSIRHLALVSLIVALEVPLHHGISNRFNSFLYLIIYFQDRLPPLLHCRQVVRTLDGEADLNQQLYLDHI